MAALSVDGTPMPALPNSADQINYDNTTSGLSATTVKGAVDELASEKQDKSDNSLQTTNKTIVGGINELKSGLTNYQSQNNINLEVPDRKNVLPMTVESIKAANTSGTWSGNSYTINGVTYIINTDASGNITSISAYGSRTESSATTRLTLANNLVAADYAGKLLSGCPNIGGENYGELFAQAVGGSYSVLADDFGDTTGVSISTSSYPMRVCISVGTSFNVAESDAVAFYPMIRPATITDPTFAPYIPSVESRIEAVESGLVKITKESFEQITVNAGSKKFVTNIGLLTDNVVVTAYSDNSDVIAYVATATTTYQVYLYNPTNSAVTSNITVMVAKV